MAHGAGPAFHTARRTSSGAAAASDGIRRGSCPDERPGPETQRPSQISGVVKHRALTLLGQMRSIAYGADRRPSAAPGNRRDRPRSWPRRSFDRSAPARRGSPARSPRRSAVRYRRPRRFHRKGGIPRRRRRRPGQRGSRPASATCSPEHLQPPAVAGQWGDEARRQVCRQRQSTVALAAVAIMRTPRTSSLFGG